MTVDAWRFRVRAWDDHRPRNAADSWKPRWARPLLMNQLNRMHWATVGRVMELWQTATMEALLEHDFHRLRLEACEFEFLPVYQRSAADTAASAPTEKAIVDGCVKMGLIADDNRFHNLGQTSYSPQFSNWTGVTVRITSRPVVEGHRPRVECGCRESMELAQRANEMKRQKAKRTPSKRS